MTPPEPQQRAIEIPEDQWVPKAGWTTMAKRALKHGYKVRVTYSRGWMIGRHLAGEETASVGDLTHGLLLRIYTPGRLTPEALAYWWAKASDDDTDNLRPTRKYDFKGAMISGQGHKATSTELTAWITRPEETS